ncbi:MAG: esterase-like activity of phytase family protein [Bacteroidaceae bacterium]|nr:esterase-like activity of phytase family protein [Bacteroidaceae bacterium]
MRRNLIFIYCLLMAARMVAQVEVLADNRAQRFHKVFPTGQYSGITHIKDSLFAVVTDDEAGFAFHLWALDLDEESGKIRHAEYLGRRGDGTEVRHDLEGIAYNPYSNTLFISNERDHTVVELDMDGRRTGRQIDLPGDVRSAIARNSSLEALSYDAANHILWTGIEGTISLDGEQPTTTNGEPALCRLFAYDDSLRLVKTIRYRTEPPTKRKAARTYALGISEIAAVGDGRMLVMEREVRVPKRFIGSTATVRIYLIDAENTKEGEVADKQLVTTIKTRVNLVRQNWANYEGMTLTPMRGDGSRTLVLVADSQARYKGVLRDWVKTIHLRFGSR